MNKPFYSDYVKHAMRFYSRNLEKTEFSCEADESNWSACNYVLNAFVPLTKDILIMVYGGYDTLADNVYSAARKYNIRQKAIWDIMKEFEKLVAKRRGLI